MDDTCRLLSEIRFRNAVPIQIFRRNVNIVCEMLFFPIVLPICCSVGKFNGGKKGFIFQWAEYWVF